MSNSQISSLFRDVAAAYIIKDENKYRFQIIAYQNASEIIKNLTIELKDLYEEGKLENIPGIGPTIRKRLEELFETGSVKHFDWVKKNIPEAVFTLLDIPSFGPKKAYKLVTTFKLKHSSTALEQIENLAKKHKIREISGFGDKSERDILRSISEFRQNVGKLRRMNLPYAMDTANKIISYMKLCKDVKKIEILGSLRRKKETVGDIDIAVATDNPYEVLNFFTKYKHIDRIIEKGDATASILISGGTQIDLMTQPLSNFGSLIQHQTGSKKHNIKLRELALKKGLSLSEYGIKKTTIKNFSLLSCSTEEAFYSKLGMQWIPPEIREDQGEIELALHHKLPVLVDIKNIKGDLHVHSSFPIEPSHDLGKSSIKEILNKALDLGYEYIGLSEHNPSISKHTQDQIYEIIKRRNKEIEQQNKNNNGVRIFKLLEVDILPNGDIPLDSKSLDLLDAVIVSVHSSFTQSKKTMTQRILRGLSVPKAKILGHPTGRILGERPAYEIDWSQIFDFCLKHNKAIEINSWPKRLDPPDQIIMEGVKKGVKFVINTDSHAVWQLDLMKFGVYIARRGWAKKNDILNTLSYNEFNKWLKGGESG